MLERRTKIVATLGPATDAPEVIDRLVAAGMDCARLNCSHGGPDELLRRAAEVRAAGKRVQRPIGLLFDLQGPKLRLSHDTRERMVVPGETIVFQGSRGASGPDRVSVDFADFAALVTPESEVVVGDGVPRFRVVQVGPGEVVTTAMAPGPVAPRKGVNVTYARPELPAITEKDARDLALAVQAGADFVALSFVRSGADLEQLRARLHELGSTARTVAKIEKIEAYEKLDEILEVADGVMVARGDYGVEAGVARVPLMQKDTIRRATQAGKLVITATQMLESMINAPEPTRAEATDVANAVIDGTSAVMLSAETSVGSYPVEAVRAMAQVAEAAEQFPEIHGRAREAKIDTPAAAVMHAAVDLAEEVGADALIVPTSSGGAARACAKYRRRRPIIALSPNPHVAAQLSIEWGVYARHMEAANTTDELFDRALEAARDFSGLPPGARVVITGGRRTSISGATNLIMVRELP
jgi:pyruvate kinase